LARASAARTTVAAGSVTDVSAETEPGQGSAPAETVRVPRSRTPADAIEDTALEDAEIEATLAGYRRWVAAGRPGAVPHAEVMAELLRGGQ
jgi:predicted transcriptional regulator